MKFFFLAASGAMLSLSVIAQEQPASRAITTDEYEKAKTFSVKDLDKDTYVKFENTYVLDRYESRKPYFITGDDGMKKRVDMYKLILKDGMQELGTMIYYTNEKGKLYKVCLPGFKADSKIWEKYFTDIHAIDKEEPNFVLKLSYILSKEFGFQLYKASTGGKDISKEAGTYGTDICFPGNMKVSMADGSTKMLSKIQAGEKVITVDAVTHTAKETIVKELSVHEAKNYALTNILLLSATEKRSATGTDVQLRTKELSVTPNHPLLTTTGEKHAGEVKEGDKVLCKDAQGTAYKEYTVFYVNEKAGGLQKVYNIVAESGDTFIMNDVMVMQKGKN